MQEDNMTKIEEDVIDYIICDMEETEKKFQRFVKIDENTLGYTDKTIKSILMEDYGLEENTEEYSEHKKAFENAKFGMELIYNPQKPVAYKFYKFEDVNDISKIPTLTIGELEDENKDDPLHVQSQSKKVGMTLNNVNKSNEVISNAYLLANGTNEPVEYRMLGENETSNYYSNGIIYTAEAGKADAFEKAKKYGYQY